MNIILKEIVKKYFYGDSHIYNKIKYYTDKLYYNNVIDEIKMFKAVILYKTCKKSHNKRIKFYNDIYFESFDNFYSQVKNSEYNIKKFHESSLYNFTMISKIYFKISNTVNKSGYTFDLPKDFFDAHKFILNDINKVILNNNIKINMNDHDYKFNKIKRLINKINLYK